MCKLQAVYLWYWKHFKDILFYLLKLRMSRCIPLNAVLKHQHKRTVYTSYLVQSSILRRSRPRCGEGMHVFVTGPAAGGEGICRL